MNVATFLHPSVSPGAVEQYGGKGIVFHVGFPRWTQVEAALVFGGDGTMHRHLPQLRTFQVPVLVVPRGSGNDFAHALGIDRKSTRLNSSHVEISYAVFC